jgi:hypothetical protein
MSQPPSCMAFDHHHGRLERDDAKMRSVQSSLKSAIALLTLPVKYIMHIIIIIIRHIIAGDLGAKSSQNLCALYELTT